MTTAVHRFSMIAIDAHALGDRDVWARAAFAFADELALSRERTVLLDGHLMVALPDGMVVDRETDRAHLGPTGSRFTLDAVELHGVTGDELHEQVAATIGVRGSRRERLAVVKPWLAYAIEPAFPPRVGNRLLVFAAYAASARGTVEILMFYVDEAGVDDAAGWATLARRIASTMIPVAAKSPRSTIDSRPAKPQLPRGWRLASRGDGSSRLSSPRGTRHYCEIHDGELDAHAASSTTTQMLAGKLRGKDVFWTVWTEGVQSHAETMTGAERWGTLHVMCHAPRTPELVELRRTIEALFREQP